MTDDLKFIYSTKFVFTSRETENPKPVYHREKGPVPKINLDNLLSPEMNKF